MFGNLFNQRKSGQEDPNQDPNVQTSSDTNAGVPAGTDPNASVGMADPNAGMTSNPPSAVPPVQPPATEQTTTTIGFSSGMASADPSQVVIQQQPPIQVTVPPASPPPAQGATGTAPADPSGLPGQQNTAAQTQEQQADVPSGTIPQPPSPETGSAGAPAAIQAGTNGSQQDQPPSDLQKRESMSAMSRLDPRSTQVLHHAKEETKRIHQGLIEPDQLLFGLIYDGEVFKLFEQFSLDAAKISKEIQAKEQMGTFNGEPSLSPQSQQILEEAYGNTKNRGASFITPEDILVALFSSALAADFLKTQGLEKQAVEQKLAKTGSYATARMSMLDKFGVDLTEEAKSGTLDPVTGRDKETERLIHILLRRTKNNPIIIGEPGVGKTAIVEHLAQRIVEGNVPADLKDRRLIQLDITSLIAGASHRGEFEERLRGVVKEVQASDGQVILFIDEIHSLIGAGDSDGAMDASNIIKPFLARGQLQVIGTTTIAEYRKYFQKDKAFERRFQSIQADEPSEEVAIEMLNIIKPKYEKYHNVTFLPDAIEGAVHLSKKYIGERFLPDKGVDLLDEAAAEVKLQVNAGQRQDNQVNKSDIEKVVSNWTSIPITRLTEDESEKLLQLEDLIHKRLIDQEEAVSAVAEAVRRGRIGLAAANRPVASFIFLGPTGVGKTELAKTLAEIMFGRDDAMIRLDMSEYMEKHEVAKLIGAPPGYVGYEEGGQLTEAVRAKPYSIVLLDEVEKAHPDVFNILLQLLEDGRLTDNKGNTISFKNTIIIATSNLGSQVIQKYLLQQGQKQEDAQKEEKAKQPEQQMQDQSENKGPKEDPNAPNGSQEDQQKGEQAAEQKDQPADKKVNEKKDISFDELNNLLLEELHKFFRPELLNRFDGLVVFKPLSQEHMASIAKLGIDKTSKLLKEQGYSVQITQNALDVLAKEGYDPVYGARPLRRLIQTAIENPIALEIIGKKYIPGDIILIDYDTAKSQFVFVKGAPQPGTAQGQPDNPGVPQPPAPGTDFSAGSNPPTDNQQPATSTDTSGAVNSDQSGTQPGAASAGDTPSNNSQPETVNPQSLGGPYASVSPDVNQTQNQDSAGGLIGQNPQQQPPPPEVNGNGQTMQANGTANTTIN